MPKISLDEFCNQWARAKTQRAWSSRLAYNAEEFSTKAGTYTLSRFRTSFAEGGFYGGSKWSPRTSKWGKKHSHPVMIDQGALRSAIKGEKGQGGTYSTFGKRDYKRNYRYSIWTNEVSVPVKGKRGKKSGRYKNYAAVHNTDPKFGLYTVNQYSSRSPVQRQFIGHSDKLLNTINSLFVPEIFKGFPGILSSAK